MKRGVVQPGLCGIDPISRKLIALPAPHGERWRCFEIAGNATRHKKGKKSGRGKRRRSS